MRRDTTTVKDFKKLIANIPEEYDDYRVTNCGTIGLEWMGISHKDRCLVIEFGIYPSKNPVEIEECD